MNKDTRTDITLQGLRESFEWLSKASTMPEVDYRILFVKNKFFKFTRDGIFHIPDIRKINYHGKKITEEDLKNIMLDENNQ